VITVTDVGVFVAWMIALSIGVERVVEILKGMFPLLTGRRTAVQALSVVSGTLIAVVVGPHTLLPLLPGADAASWLGAGFLGLSASGGAAFWHHLLDILGAVKAVGEAKAGTKPAIGPGTSARLPGTLPSAVSPARAHATSV
jgi:hypothetical protein